MGESVDGMLLVALSVKQYRSPRLAVPTVSVGTIRRTAVPSFERVRVMSVKRVCVRLTHTLRPEVRMDASYSAVRLLTAGVVLTARGMGNVLLEALVQPQLFGPGSQDLLTPQKQEVELVVDVLPSPHGVQSPPLMYVLAAQTHVLESKSHTLPGAVQLQLPEPATALEDPATQVVQLTPLK